MPNLAQNSLRADQLLEKDYKMEFNKDKCTIVDKQENLTMAKIKMSSNKVLPLNMPVIEKVVLKGTTYEDHHFWHLRYFLLFVDDYSRMMWVYIIKQKSDTFQSFLDFKARVENQIDKRIKTLRTDRGGEFIGKSFMNYCKEKEIHRQLTVRYSLQQNGVAE